MAEVVLAAEVGRPTGSRAVRRLRREGKIPAVIYGHGTDPLPVAIVARELRVALNSEAGASDISAMATHAVLSDPAVDRLKAAPISRVVVTDTLPVAEDRIFDKLEVLSVAKIIADAIDAVFEDTSVSELFGGDNLV